MLESTMVKDDGDVDALLSAAPHHIDRLLGDVLCSSKLINKSQLSQALLRQKRIKKPLGELLVDMGCVSHEQVMVVLSLKCGIPYVNLESFQPQKQTLQVIPPELVLQYHVFPLSRHHKRLIVACENPLSAPGLDLIRFQTGLNVMPVLAGRRDITRLINRYYNSDQHQAAFEQASLTINETQQTYANQQTRRLESEANRKPVVRMVNSIIFQGLLREASDINIRPLNSQSQGGQLQVYYRIDGQMQFARTVPIDMHRALVSRLKILASMDITERRLPQDGHARIHRGGKDIDLRLSIVPTVHGESVVIRILDREHGVRRLADLGLLMRDSHKIRDCLAQGTGLFLVVGSTGSGKSTTLYALINELSKESHHILTVEDPVEFDMPGIEQVQVGRRKGMSFASALRHFLRHDPDVIMIGEIRDKETAELACRAALTGHMVLSTLHTRDAVGAIARLHDMGIENYVLSSVLKGVMAQRLIRKVCHHCAKPIDASDEVRSKLGISDDANLMRGEGCEYCYGSGYLGRVLISEMMAVSDELIGLINRGATADEVLACAELQGMERLSKQAMALVESGQASLQDVFALAYEEE